MIAGGTKACSVLTQLVGERSDVAVLAAGLVLTPVWIKVNVTYGGQDAKAIGPHDAAVRVDHVYEFGVCKVQSFVRVQSSALKGE
jgi:hypothetical protein